MKKYYGELIYFKTPYRPDPGSFCKPKQIDKNEYKGGNWYYCRELFHSQLHNLDLFFFTHSPKKGECVAKFIKKIEDKLRVYPPSEFGPTQRKTIMWIRPSRWWTARSMRRSLFTILLRAANDYDMEKDNFEEALFSEPYIIGTKYAVLRFLDGNVVYTGKKSGWYKQFYEDKLSEREIDMLLITPY